MCTLSPKQLAAVARIAGFDVRLYDLRSRAGRRDVIEKILDQLEADECLAPRSKGSYVSLREIIRQCVPDFFRDGVVQYTERNREESRASCALYSAWQAAVAHGETTLGFGSWTTAMRCGKPPLRRMYMEYSD
jgi:hypothetical protein